MDFAKKIVTAEYNVSAVRLLKKTGLVLGALGAMGVVAFLGAHLGGWVPDYSAIQKPEVISGATALTGVFLYGLGESIRENWAPRGTRALRAAQSKRLER